MTDANIAGFFPTGLTFTTILNAGTSSTLVYNGYTFNPLTKAAANNSSNGGPSVNNFNYDASNAPPGANSTYGQGGSGTYPPDGISSGTFLYSLLNGFIFDDGDPVFGNLVGDYQTYTLSGLAVGETYDTRIYIRAWENGAEGATNGQTSRSNTLFFDSGVDTGMATILEDNPSAQIGVPGNPAYFVGYHFTAGAPTLSIQAVMNADPNGNPVGSFHLYAITNQVAEVPEPPSAALVAMVLIGWSARKLRRSRPHRS